jgi:polysaccharide biosynthesis transport protein
MEVRHYLQILWRRAGIIVVTTIVTAAIVAVGTWMIAPTYEASAILRVPTAAAGSETWIDYDTMYTDRLLETYARIATSGPVLTQVAEQLGLTESLQVDVSVIAGTELMRITAESPDPVVARDGANVLAETLIAMREEELAQGLQTRLGAVSDMAMFSLVVPAEAPTEPVQPRRAMYLAMGVLVGLAGGVALALVVENVDTTLYSTEMVEAATDLPIVGMVPGRKRLINPARTLYNGNSPHTQAFRQIAANVNAHLARSADGAARRTLIVTSAEPKEGKSTVAANLAAALADSGFRVVVVDADLRRPAQHEIFNAPNDVGLSDLLTSDATLSTGLQESGVPGVHLLSSGSLSQQKESNAVFKLLSSARMQALLAKLGDMYDVTLIDTPALLPVADATGLVSNRMADVLLVIGRGQTSREDVEQVERQLRGVGANCVGVVINRAQRIGSHRTTRAYKHYLR